MKIAFRPFVSIVVTYGENEYGNLEYQIEIWRKALGRDIS